MNESDRAHLRHLCETDTFFLARDILGHTWSLVEYEDENGRKRGGTFDGDEWGISRLTPHKDMVEFLDGPELNKLLLCPRSSYKSTLIVVKCVQRILQNPNIRILYAMKVYEEAQKKVEAIKEIFEANELLIELYGDFQTRKWSSKRFTVATRTRRGMHNPTVEAGGVDKSNTGNHYDLGVLDDLVDKKNVQTATGLLSVDNYVEEVEPLIDPGCEKWFIGTRYHELDKYGKIKREQSQDFAIFEIGCGYRIVADGDGGEEMVPTPENVEDKPLYPHLTRPVLEAKWRSMGTRAWTSQYENKILSGAQAVFHRKQFQFIQWEDWMETFRAYLLVDTATKKEEDGCFSCVHVVAMDSIHNAYLLDSIMGRWQPNTVVERIFEMHELWEQRVPIGGVLMEEVTMNRVFSAMIENEGRTRQTRINLIPTKRGISEGTKDERIMGLQYRFAHKQFFVVDTCNRYYQDAGQTLVYFDPNGFKDESGETMPGGELVDQFVQFPAWGRKDAADAMADIEATDSKGRRICRGSGKAHAQAQRAGVLDFQRKRAEMRKARGSVERRSTWDRINAKRRRRMR